MRTVLVALSLLGAARLFAQTPEALRQLDYDQRAPLDLEETGIERRGGVSIHDISFVSPKGGRVPAYLVVPDGKGPFAAVLWGHWYWDNSDFRNRKEFLEESVALAPAGVVSLMTDGPVARPGHVEDKGPLNDHEITDLIQAIVDMRRGADLLLAPHRHRSQALGLRGSQLQRVGRGLFEWPRQAFRGVRPDGRRIV